MTGFILAGVLGAIALVMALLFRQLRRLSWQLTQLRVERDSESILHDIGLRPEREPQLAEQTADATLGDLYRDGGLAAVLLELSDLSPSRRYLLVASGMVATIAVALVTILLAISSGAAPIGAGHSPPPAIVSPEPKAAPPEPIRSPDPPPDDQPPASADVHLAGIDPAQPVVETTAVSVRSPQDPSSGPELPPSSSAQPESSKQPTAPESSGPAPSVSPSGADPPFAELCVGVRPLLEMRLCLGLDR